MKKIHKSAIALSAAVVLAGVSAVPALVTAWGDSDGGRPSYTIDQINQGVLGDKIVFNSISNSVIGDEKNFVGAREDNGDKGSGNIWHGNEIAVEDGKTYVVRLYVHNNNPKGEQAVAENVTTAINIPGASGKTVEVNGFITASNASPAKYWDDIKFTSNSNFHLEYVSGSALLENNGIGAGGGIKLSDDIVKQNGVKIGYNALDGRVPGCYQYANYVTIKVKAVSDEGSKFAVEKKVRKTGEKGWNKSIDAKIGDEVEYQIQYDNTGNATQNNVMIKDVLPKNMEYVKGSTKLWNSNHPDGVGIKQDTVVTTGINIGNYNAGSNGYVRFKAKVVDNNLNCGANTVVNWGQAGVGQKTLQDRADVKIEKACPAPPTPTPPTPIPENPVTPSSIPSTGPVSIVSGILGAGALVTSAGYYIASRKELKGRK